MKKATILGMSLTLLFSLNTVAITPVAASAMGSNVTQQETSQSMTTKANNALTAPTTDPLPSPQEHGETIIFDKNGNVVPMTELQNKPSLQPRSATQPTRVKYLSKGQSYWSEDFSASGMRYGGYMFTLSGTKNVHVTANKGAFTIYFTDRPEANAVVRPGYLTPSGSPYRVVTDQWFYFGVNNPISGQNYYLQAY